MSNSLFSNFYKFAFAEEPRGKIWVTTLAKIENSLQYLDPKTDGFVPSVNLSR
jgi:hypothetical protein